MNGKMKQYVLPALVILLLAVGVSGCSLVPVQAQAEPTATLPPVENEPVVIAEGRLAPLASAELSFKASGQVVEVLVQEGDEVEQGAALARLGDREQAEAAVRAAQLELLDAQKALKGLNDRAGVERGAAQREVAEAQQAVIEAQEALDEIDTDDYQEQIDDAWVEVVDARDELEDAQEEFDKYADLDRDHPQRRDAEDALEDAQQAYDEAMREYDRLRNDLEQKRADLALAEERLQDANRRYENWKDGPDPDELALANERVSNAEAQLAAAQAALANLELVAPFAGKVARVDISAGEYVAPNQVVIVLADFSRWVVETDDLTEMEVVKIDTSRPVLVTPDALPTLELQGEVERVAEYYQEKAGDVTYEVRVLLNDGDPRLRWGMTVEVRFEIDGQ